ncbi:NusA N-terminal domain-containing protein, partial [Oleiphilus sp. HI0128]
EILLVVEAVSNEKGVEKDIIFEAIELALAAATKKRYEDEEDANIEVKIDRKTGDHETFRHWTIVDNEAVPGLGTELTMQEAEEIDTSLQPGDIHTEQVESISFGRIGAQAAKQIIVQKVREAEREKIVDSYRDRVGELVSGTVKKVTRDNV